MTTPIDAYELEDRFGVEIWFDRRGLTDAQVERLENKLPLVKQAAIHLAAGMLKGVLKYETDKYTSKEWRKYQFDDLCDALNYFMLGEEAQDEQDWPCPNDGSG